MIPYATESFTAQERAVLMRHFTNTDLPVFALTNLPEVVKGALFARYSRTNKSLRRLFLDEFADDIDSNAEAGSSTGMARATALYDKVFTDYGDDSVAQLGGVHLACEQASNLLTKVLERGRLAAYLEQSTRYVPYDVRLPNGRYRYYRDPNILNSELGARYVADMDRLFESYAAMLPRLQTFLFQRYPAPKEISELAWRRSIRAKTFDLLRGLLPVGALSNVGIFASGQAYEHLLLRMRASNLPEARSYSEMMLQELRKVAPAFFTRVDRPDRGGEAVRYTVQARSETEGLVRTLLGDSDSRTSPGHGSVALPASDAVALTDFDPQGEDKVVAAILYELSSLSDYEATAAAQRLSLSEKENLIRAYCGQRGNRRHKPGRAFERTDYRFDVVSDYGAFRDLQRHRILTIEWQGLSSELGYEIAQDVKEAKLESEYRKCLDRSASLHEALVPNFPYQAAYALGLAWKIRYSIQLNVRSAMHLLELRSSPQGHASYRTIAQRMHSAIGEVAGHKALAAVMKYVDHEDSDLGRIQAEQRLELQRVQAE